MALVPTEEKIETKARELADKHGPGWASVESEGSTDLETRAKSYWLKKAEEALKTERRNAP